MLDALSRNLISSGAFGFGHIQGAFPQEFLWQHASRPHCLWEPDLTKPCRIKVKGHGASALTTIISFELTGSLSTTKDK